MPDCFYNNEAFAIFCSINNAVIAYSKTEVACPLPCQFIMMNIIGISGDPKQVSQNTFKHGTIQTL